MDSLVRKKSMFSSKADGYFHDVILIFSQREVFAARRSFTWREKLYSLHGILHDRVIYFHSVFMPIQRNFTEIPIILLHFTVVACN